jgi:heme-degrading monooxygenase HmoA
MEELMFVATARFPEVAFEREAEFLAWFAWSNGQLRGIDGLRGRRLLRAQDGSYTALVEHENADTFAAMHATDVAARVHARLREVLDDEPVTTAFDVVENLAKSGACCAGGAGHDGHGRRDEVTFGVSTVAPLVGQSPTALT